MIKCFVEWNDNNNTWRCSYYLMCHGIDFSESRDKCYHYNCRGRQERYKPEPIVESIVESEPIVEVESVLICSEEGCNNPVPPNHREHCSLRCRKRMNGRAYRERKKKLKNG